MICHALSGKEYRCLFHDQVILYGMDPFDAARDFSRFIESILRCNENAP
jgi:hypothetical protein